LGAETRALVRYNSAANIGFLDKSPLRPQIAVTAADLRDPDSIEDAFGGVDIVYHLGALIGIPYSYSAPSAYVRTNILGTLNVLQAARDSDVGLLVHTSTSEVYGTAVTVPMDEQHPLRGQSPYAATKIGADKLVEAFQHSFDLPAVTIRPFNNYGPRQSQRAVVPTIISQALTASEVRLGSLSPTRDFNYVADTVEAFLLAAACPKARGQVINIGSGRETSIGDLASTVLRLVGRDIPIVADSDRIRPAASEVERLCANSQLAHRLLGWRPHHTLEGGLAETIQWVKEHLERYEVGAYTI
jgi:dTDP-glucose 4,6-dehydratase